MARPKMPLKQRNIMRQSIVDAAKGLFYESGIDAVSIRNIAKSVGVGPATIYTYFDGTYEILSHIWWDVVYQLEDALVEAAKGIDHPAGRLEAILRRYVLFAKEHAKEFQITFLTLNLPSDKVETMIPDSLQRPGFKLIYDTIAGGVKEGIFEVEDVNRSAQVTWSCIHGAISTPKQIAGFAWLSNDELVEGTLDLVFHGLLPSKVRHEFNPSDSVTNQTHE